MTKQIALLAGDGIGPEITAGAVEVLRKIGERFSHTFIFLPLLIGGAAVDKCADPLPQETIDGCLASDGVLLGAVGGPKWESLLPELRPETGLLRIRKEMGLYANLRPARLWKELAFASPLRSAEKRGIDLIVVRELTGGIYFGERSTYSDENLGLTARDTEQYSVFEIERIAKIACELAGKRSGRIVSVDKANVLDTSRLWRKTVHSFAERYYPEITVEDMLVDNAAMQLVRDPSQFDILLTSNLFGDILSDEAAQVTGSIGMLPSSSLGEGTRGLYEPIHGSAPAIAGKDIANPIATILSCAMMLRDSFGMTREAETVERAVGQTLSEGYRTAEIAEGAAEVVGCKKMSDLIAERI